MKYKGSHDRMVTVSRLAELIFSYRDNQALTDGWTAMQPHIYPIMFMIFNRNRLQ